MSTETTEMLVFDEGAHCIFLKRFQKVLPSMEPIKMQLGVADLCAVASSEAKEVSLNISRLRAMAAELRAKLKRLDEDFCSAAKPQTFDETKKDDAKRAFSYAETA